eukprot:4559417-Pyramimonas_sp.AAC.1
MQAQGPGIHAASRCGEQGGNSGRRGARRGHRVALQAALSGQPGGGGSERARAFSEGSEAPLAF